MEFKQPKPCYYHPYLGVYFDKPSAFNKKKGWLYFASKAELDCYKKLLFLLGDGYSIITQPSIALLLASGKFPESRHCIDFAILPSTDSSRLLYLEYKGDWVKYIPSALEYVALKTQLILRQGIPYAVVSERGDILPESLKKFEIKYSNLPSFIEKNKAKWNGKRT